MTLEIAVCEDVPGICDELCRQIENCFSEKKCSVNITPYTSPLQMQREIGTRFFHVCFLDIDMPDINGMDLAGQIRAAWPDRVTVIIFVSNRDDLVFDSLKVRPLRFIRKNHFADELPEAADAVLDFYSRNPEVLLIEHNGSITALSISEIYYMESFNRVIVIHTKQGDHTVYARLNDMEDRLKTHGFLRIHKSFLVNWQYIYSIESHSVLLENRQQLPLSKHRITAIKNEYKTLMKTSVSVR